MTITPLPYSLNLINHYDSLSHLPGFVLLESSDHHHGRYDILSALPYDSLTIFRDELLSVQDAFNLLQAKMLTRDSLGDFPFQGGGIGYIAYDFAEALAGIQSNPHPANDMPLIDIKFYDWGIVTDHYQRSVHLITQGQHTDTQSLIDEIKARWMQASLKVHFFKLEQEFIPLISRADYEHHVKSIHRDLMIGRAYQVNYTQAFLAHYSGEPWQIYKKIRVKNPVPYGAFIRANEGDIISFSPEHFISMDNHRVKTSPIKGTIKRSSDPIKDHQLRLELINSAKNQAENVMIVDLLRNDFGKIARPGSVNVTSLCEVQSFSQVHHLVSQIEADCLDGLGGLDILKACFPGGSITGAPKRESMYIINEHEPFSRGVYCGSIAYFSSHGRFDSNIAIRTITAKEDTLYLSAGGGLVIDSNSRDEYQESLIKVSAIIRALTDT